jgi:hypothetical protein
MSYKSENWQDKLKEVRQYGTFSKHSKGSLEESADDIINKEIEEELRLLESQIEEEIVEEEVILEASAGDMIDKLFNLKGDKDSQYGVAKMLSMTGVKVVQSMQKQNPQGFSKLVAQLGKEKKITLPTNNKLQKMFKDAGVKPMPEEVEVKESVEKSIEKLTEKNMLGRLAKQLQLNEEGKQKMFDYFTKGELEQ